MNAVTRLMRRSTEMRCEIKSKKTGQLPTTNISEIFILASVSIECTWTSLQSHCWGKRLHEKLQWSTKTSSIYVDLKDEHVIHEVETYCIFAYLFVQGKGTQEELRRSSGISRNLRRSVLIHNLI